MTKNEYLKLLQKYLRRLKENERSQTILYYSEQIDDRMEGGLPEESAVAQLELPECVAHKLLEEAKNTGQLKPKRSLFELLLLIVGAPVWLSLIIVACAVFISLMAAAWAIIISVAACELAFGVSAVAGFGVSGIMITQNVPSGLFTLGSSLVLAGLCLILLMPIIKLIKLSASYTEKLFKLLFKQVLKIEGKEI